MYKSLEPLWSVNLYCTVHVHNKASISSFNNSKEHSIAPHPLQFSMKLSVLDVFCVPQEANLCLLHPGLWPVRLTHMDNTSEFPYLLAASSIDRKNEQNFGG